MYTSILVHISVVPAMANRVYQISWSWQLWATRYGWKELNLGSMKEQFLFISTEPSSQPSSCQLLILLILFSIVFPFLIFVLLPNDWYSVLYILRKNELYNYLKTERWRKWGYRLPTVLKTCGNEEAMKMKTSQSCNSEKSWSTF